MFDTYLAVTILAAAANIFSATCDFVRYKQVSIAMANAGVPESWMTMLGILKAAGALGLLVGIGVPLHLDGEFSAFSIPKSLSSLDASCGSYAMILNRAATSNWLPFSSKNPMF